MDEFDKTSEGMKREFLGRVKKSVSHQNFRCRCKLVHLQKLTLKPYLWLSPFNSHILFVYPMERTYEDQRKN